VGYGGTPECVMKRVSDHGGKSSTKGMALALNGVWAQPPTVGKEEDVEMEGRKSMTPKRVPGCRKGKWAGDKRGIQKGSQLFEGKYEVYDRGRDCECGGHRWHCGQKKN